MKQKKKTTVKLAIGAILVALSFAFGGDNYAAPEPAISLTFDDAWISQYEYAAPILKAADQKGTLYIPTGLVGTDGFMDWDNVVDMVQDGWEMGGHTVNHLELPLLTEEELEQQIEENFETLEAHGLMPYDFATPFGAYDPTVIANIAKYFNSQRGFHDIGYNVWPYNKYLLHVQQVTNQTTLEEVETWVQEAVANNYWLIIVFHDIMPTVDIENTYAWSTENLENLMSYLNDNGIKTKNMAEVLNMKDSMLPNSNFDNGVADGWTTQTPVEVSPNFDEMGAVPTPKSSIRMIGTTTTTYLFSPDVRVSTSTEYGIRVFTNTVEMASGEFGYYIDEYNEAGEWVSWKFLGTASLNDVIDNSYFYQPTLDTVAFAGLRIYMAANSTGVVYVDNANFFEMGEGEPLPTPNPIAFSIEEPPFVNSDFNSGFYGGWTTTNEDYVVPDESNRGQSPTENSTIKMTGTDLDVYLFSPKVLVSADNNYDIIAYTDARDLNAGEIGYYLDEYDANEVWISGRWLGLKNLGSTGNLKFEYKPSSEQVVSASLQTYLTANSTGDVYLDNLDLNIAEAPLPPVELPMPNSDFDLGFDQGWKTNDEYQVIFDNNGFGQAPTASSTIKMVGTNSDSYLFSPKVLVSNTNNYEIVAYTDASNLSNGEIGYYIDEYDDGGNWISGRWLGYQSLGVSGNLTFSYIPTSEKVVSASLQAYLTGGSVGYVYLDNLDLNIAETSLSPVELPMPNSDFELGLDMGWKTNNEAYVVFDGNEFGQAPTASSTIKMTGTNSDSYLFSPKVLVSNTNNYEIVAYTDANDLIFGEVGYYVDEYDINGNWISGRWLGLKSIRSVGNSIFAYTPTSEQVVSASLQTYLTKGSLGNVYLDNLNINIIESK